MTGSAFSAMDVMLMKRSASRGEVRRGDTRRESLLSDPGGLLPNHIYIYTKTQLFRISILERFWRGLGEVLERDFYQKKLQKHCVLQWFLIATIKKPLVFLGFS